MKKLFTTLAFITLCITATFSQIEYTWTGALNQNFSAAANWNPVRAVGLYTDLLVFNNGISNDILNVPTVSIGQMRIENNTSVQFTPFDGSGSANTVTIRGTTANNLPDLSIESGSTLFIHSIEKSLSFYLNTGANAVINGNLRTDGPLAMYICAFDYHGITVNGTIDQYTPGCLFQGTTVGNPHIAYLSAGSTMRVSNTALSPFGPTPTVPKAEFDPNSNFIIYMSISNPISFFGAGNEAYGNFSIIQGCNISLTRQNIDFHCSYFTVDANCSLTMLKCIGTMNVFCYNWQGAVSINPEVEFNSNCLKQTDDFSYTPPKTIVSVKIYNLLGQLISSGDNFSSLKVPTGVYLVQTLFSDLTVNVQKQLIIK